MHAVELHARRGRWCGGSPRRRLPRRPTRPRPRGPAAEGARGPAADGARRSAENSLSLLQYHGVTCTVTSSWFKSSPAPLPRPTTRPSAAPEDHSTTRWLPRLKTTRPCGARYRMIKHYSAGRVAKRIAGMYWSRKSQRLVELACTVTSAFSARSAARFSDASAMARRPVAKKTYTMRAPPCKGLQVAIHRAAVVKQMLPGSHGSPRRRGWHRRGRRRSLRGCRGRQSRLRSAVHVFWTCIG